MKRLVLVTVAAAALSAPALAQQRQQPPAQPWQPSQQPSAQQCGHNQSSMNAGERRSIPFNKLSETQIRDLQQALSQKGHDVEADGKWGPRTQSALRDFNRSQNDFNRSQNIEGDRELSMQTVSPRPRRVKLRQRNDGPGRGSGMSPGKQPLSRHGALITVPTSKTAHG